jgi:hypothetical protein
MKRIKTYFITPPTFENWSIGAILLGRDLGQMVYMHCDSPNSMFRIWQGPIENSSLHVAFDEIQLVRWRVQD